MHVRERIFERDEAVRIYRRGVSMVTVQSGDPDPVRIINLHVGSRCASYDCEFAALAQDLGVTLVTADQQLVQAFPEFVESLI
jgi:predicted nucleic acid-binding protein